MTNIGQLFIKNLNANQISHDCDKYHLLVHIIHTLRWSRILTLLPSIRTG